MRLGLRARVALTFGVLSLVVAVAVSGTTYFLARVYLLNQRETAALTRALLDARAAGASLEAALPDGYRASERAPGSYVVQGPATPLALATIASWCAQHGVLPSALSTGHRSLEELLVEHARASVEPSEQQ